jgi:hypothetical protein
VSFRLNSGNDSNNNQSNFNVEVKASINSIISLTGKLVRGTEQRSFIPEPQIILRYKIKEHFLRERPRHIKQLTLQEIIFKKASK